MLCPTCKKQVDDPPEDQPLSPHFPFCCERCKLVDLGRWIDGKYQIPIVDRPANQNDDDLPRERN